MTIATGHVETRRWTSGLNPDASTDIEVFVPHALRESYGSSDRAALAELEQRLAALSRDTDLSLIAPILTRSEGIASSRIEGLVMSTRRIYEAQLRSDEVEDRTADQIVANMDVMSDVLNVTEPLTNDQIHGWHSALMRSEPRMRATAGSYRSQQNWIGWRADTPVGADYVPPPPEMVPQLMDDLIRFANERSLAPILQSAIVHAQFETIHPYPDGNGRVGRALIYWVLSNRGVIGDVAPPISPVIVDAAATYVGGLKAYRFESATAWVDTFISLMDSAVGYSMLVGDALGELQTSWRSRVSDVRAGSVDHRIVEHLASTPVVDAAGVARDFGVTPQAAGRALERLETRGVVVHRSLRRGKRGRPTRVFEANELFDLLDEPPRSLAARMQQPPQNAATD
jgi:Fic family protein